jgi:LacI family transcriptional regulator
MSPSGDTVAILGVLSAIVAEVGYVAAKLLDSLMDGAKPTKQMITLPPKGLVARQSTDVLAVDDSLVAEAMRYIAEQGHTGIDVDDVAEAVCTTRRTLERRFRTVLDRTVAEELLRMKIERVKRHLADTDTSIKTLALESGFINGKQMGKTFARVVGISPSEYRRQRQAK